jgi:hypothetical protein
MSQETNQQLHKQNSSELEWYIDQFGILAMQSFNNEISVDEFHVKRKELEKQCEEMIIKSKESIYADGYSEGYKRALGLIEWMVKTEIKRNE